MQTMMSMAALLRQADFPDVCNLAAMMILHCHNTRVVIAESLVRLLRREYQGSKCIQKAFVLQLAVLQDDGQEVSDDDSWGDELEKELEGEEVAVRIALAFSISFLVLLYQAVS